MKKLNNIIPGSFIELVNANIVPISVCLVSVYALYLRLLKLYHHELWIDEIWQLNQMTGSFSDLLKLVVTHEPCTYLAGDYYLIYPFFKAFSLNKWGLAIPHIIATIFGFYLLYRVCRRYYRTVWGYLIAFVIVCFNFNLIAHATEIRVYAVLPTLALASLFFMQVLVDSDFRMPLSKKLLIGSFFVILIWFHVYGLLIFCCTAIAALLSAKDLGRIRIIFKNFIKFTAIILAVTLPFWLYCSFIVPRGGLGGVSFTFKMNVNDWIPSPVTNTIGFLKGVFGNLVGCKKLYFLLAGALFPFVLPFDRRLRAIYFCICVIFLPVAAIYVLDIITGYFFVPRQFVWVIPLFAIYLGWSWDSFFIMLIDMSHAQLFMKRAMSQREKRYL